MDKKIIADTPTIRTVEWTRIALSDTVDATRRDSLVVCARRNIARAARRYLPFRYNVKLDSYVDADGTAVVEVTAHPNAIRTLARWV